MFWVFYFGEKTKIPFRAMFISPAFFCIICTKLMDHRKLTDLHPTTLNDWTETDGTDGFVQHLFSSSPYINTGVYTRLLLTTIIRQKNTQRCSVETRTSGTTFMLHFLYTHCIFPAGECRWQFITSWYVSHTQQLYEATALLSLTSTLFSSLSLLSHT